MKIRLAKADITTLKTMGTIVRYDFERNITIVEDEPIWMVRLRLLFCGAVLLTPVLGTIWANTRECCAFKYECVDPQEFHDEQWWARQERSCLIEQGCITGREVNHP